MFSGYWVIPQQEKYVDTDPSKLYIPVKTVEKCVELCNNRLSWLHTAAVAVDLMESKSLTEQKLKVLADDLGFKL